MADDVRHALDPHEHRDEQRPHHEAVRDALGVDVEASELEEQRRAVRRVERVDDADEHEQRELPAQLVQRGGNALGRQREQRSRHEGCAHEVRFEAEHRERDDAREEDCGHSRMECLERGFVHADG